jgi:hypothetical protein
MSRRSLKLWPPCRGLADQVAKLKKLKKGRNQIVSALFAAPNVRWARTPFPAFLDASRSSVRFY